MIFLFPTDSEARLFRQAAPDAEVVICGVGMAAAAAAMAQLARDLGDVDLVVLAGIAGSYNLERLPIDEVVEVVSEEIEELPNRFRKVYRVEPRLALRAVRSNTVNRSNYRGATSEIENMEGAAVMAICEALKIPCVEIRAISNLVGDSIERWSVESAISALTDRLIEIYRG